MNARWPAAQLAVPGFAPACWLLVAGGPQAGCAHQALPAQPRPSHPDSPSTPLVLRLGLASASNSAHATPEPPSSLPLTPAPTHPHPQLNLFEGTCYLTPLLGAWLADSLWGRYKTIIVFSVIYFLVRLALMPGSASSAGTAGTASALAPSLRTTTCA